MGLSATLLFLVQPLFAKMTLPLLGGSPSVWNTAMAFFQGVLLLGYLYAHGLQKLRGMTTQVVVHACVLAVGAFFVPLAVSDALDRPPTDAPAFWLLGLYAVSIGAPFFALSATAPLLQAWYARTRRPDAGDPYHLYAASNVGSLAALAAYPTVIEPLTRLDAQTTGWGIGFWATAAAVLACGVFVGRQGGGAALSAPAAPRSSPVSWSRRGRWMALAFVPSSLLLGVTSHLTTDVASAPFLWVVPLALFLATFVIAFARKPLISAARAGKINAFTLALAAAALALPQARWEFAAPAHLAAFFFAALACHHLLVKARPDADRLTEFYLFMSLGGVLGGVFNAFAAPVLFDSILEYPLALAAAAGLAAAADRPGRRDAWAAGGLFTLFLGLIVVQERLADPNLALGGAAVGAGIAAAVLVRGARWFYAAALFGVVAVSGAALRFDGVIAQERGFFGVLRVVEGDGRREFYHGTTLHGAQSTDPAEARTPLTYYGARTPIGEALQARQAAGARSFAVIGLGVGATACYAEADDQWTFYEIDPLVRDIAQDPDLFRFLSDCTPDAPVVVGDARLTLADAAPGAFDVILLDAFSSDAIPTHLLTREALALYVDKLSPEGVLIAHISNRVLELESVVGDLAADAGLAVRVRKSSKLRDGADVQATHAAVLARDSETLAAFAVDRGWRAPRRFGGRLWTDDYVNIPAALWRKRAAGR